MAVADQQHPRKLVASNAYVKLLNDRDDANKIAEAIATLTPAQILAGTTGTSTFQFRVGNSVLSSAVFAKYVVQYVIKNVKTIAPDVMDLITADILLQKNEAETEMGLNGLTTTPIIPAGPTITSSLTPAKATTNQAWTYQIMADNISGAGIFSCVYALSNAPSWLSINTSTGLVQGIPQTVDIGENTFDITVTTNVSSETKTVTVDVESYALPVITPGQSITVSTGATLTPYQVQAQYAKVGQDGVTSVEWETTYTGAFTIDATTGVITGNGGSGSYTATMSVTLTTNFGSTTEDITINVVG